MPRLLTRVLSAADLPVAELCAARLDGDVYRLDDCFAAVDEAEDVTLRALALARVLPQRVIAEGPSALWVYGVLPAPPARHMVCIPRSTRARVPPSPRWLVRERALRAADVVGIGGITVVSPLHAAVDVLRSAQHYGPEERRWVAELMTYGGFEPAACLEHIRGRPSAPGTARARDRLAAAQPALTRYTS